MPFSFDKTTAIAASSLISSTAAMLSNSVSFFLLVFFQLRAVASRSCTFCLFRCKGSRWNFKSEWPCCKVTVYQSTVSLCSLSNGWIKCYTVKICWSTNCPSIHNWKQLGTRLSNCCLYWPDAGNLCFNSSPVPCFQLSAIPVSCSECLFRCCTEHIDRRTWQSLLN